MTGLRIASFVLGLLPLAALCQVQDKAEVVPLYEQDPFDQITVDADNGGGTYKVLPLDLPGRRLPADPPPGDLLTVRMLDDRDTPAQIAWRNIAKVELFEQLVLAEAQRLASAQQFEAAFDHLQFFHENYPQLVGLGEATRDFRYRNAGALFRDARHTEALALLEAVFRDEPQRSGLAAALANVSQPLFDASLQDERFDVARGLVARTAARGDEASLALSRAWQAQLEAAAQAQERLARKHFAAEDFRAAHEAAQLMLAIWPELPGGRQLAGEISQRWPLVRVGVAALQPATVCPLERAAVRTAALTHEPLASLSHFGPDGAVYVSRLGEATVDDNRSGLTIKLNRAATARPRLTGYEVVESLLARGDAQQANYDPLWASLLKSVRVDDVFHVQAALHRAHPQPLAALSATVFQGRFLAEAAKQDRVHYVAPTEAPGPREVIEIATSSPAAALADLRRGRLDLVERLLPQDALALADDASIRVGRLAVPGVHLLVPNVKRAHAANSTFRRAVAYGLDRERILRDELLGGEASDGCRTISGPFPAGGAKDAWAYAYDRQITPLPYEPRMALTLFRAADDEIARTAQQQASPPAKQTTIVIGHGQDWLHRRACQLMAEQLTRIGIAAECREISLVDRAALADCDFWYVELALHEPLVDAVKLLGRGGLVEPSPYIAVAVRDVMTAVNEQQASQRLHALHAAVHAEQAVIPLWQMVDHFAYRADSVGLEDRPVSLYRHLDRWQVGADIAAAAERPSP